MDDPPANIAPGVTSFDMLPLRILHPGLENEADIQAQSLVIRLQDAFQQPLDTGSLVADARITWDSLAVSAVVEGDSLTFDLSPLPPIPATAFAELQLQMDMVTQSQVSDFRLLLAADALTANSGGGPTLTVQEIGNLGLPYESPTIHLSSGTLEESFASYPNPFTPAQGMCNITFVLASDSRVTCDIYALSGDHVVQLLAAASLASGLHDDLTWNGRNERGETVRNGTYLLRIQVDGAGGGEFYRKLAVIR